MGVGETAAPHPRPKEIGQRARETGLCSAVKTKYSMLPEASTLGTKQSAPERAQVTNSLHSAAIPGHSAFTHSGVAEASAPFSKAGVSSASLPLRLPSVQLQYSP